MASLASLPPSETAPPSWARGALLLHALAMRSPQPRGTTTSQSPAKRAAAGLRQKCALQAALSCTGQPARPGLRLIVLLRCCRSCLLLSAGRKSHSPSGPALAPLRGIHHPPLPSLFQSLPFPLTHAHTPLVHRPVRFCQSEYSTLGKGKGDEYGVPSPPRPRPTSMGPTTITPHHPRTISPRFYPPFPFLTSPRPSLLFFLFAAARCASSVPCSGSRPAP